MACRGRELGAPDASREDKRIGREGEGIREIGYRTKRSIQKGVSKRVEVKRKKGVRNGGGPKESVWAIPVWAALRAACLPIVAD